MNWATSGVKELVSFNGSNSGSYNTNACSTSNRDALIVVHNKHTKKKYNCFNMIICDKSSMD